MSQASGPADAHLLHQPRPHVWPHSGDDWKLEFQIFTTNIILVGGIPPLPRLHGHLRPDGHGAAQHSAQVSNTRQHSAGKYDATLGSLLESEFGVAGEVKEQIVKMVSNEYRDFQQLREDKQVRHN